MQHALLPFSMRVLACLSAGATIIVRHKLPATENTDFDRPRSDKSNVLSPLFCFDPQEIVWHSVIQD